MKRKKKEKKGKKRKIDGEKNCRRKKRQDAQRIRQEETPKALALYIMSMELFY